MLVLLTSRWRQRAAAVLVALYALCLLAPATAFAFGDSFAPAHCFALSDKHQGKGEGHGQHYDGMNDSKASHDNNDPGLPGKCCGLSCVAAIAPAFDLASEPVAHLSAVAVPVVESLFGRSSSRIDRPPRSLLSF